MKYLTDDETLMGEYKNLFNEMIFFCTNVNQNVGYIM